MNLHSNGKENHTMEHHCYCPFSSFQGDYIKLSLLSWYFFYSHYFIYSLKSLAKQTYKLPVFVVLNLSYQHLCWNSLPTHLLPWKYYSLRLCFPSLTFYCPYNWALSLLYGFFLHCVFSPAYEHAVELSWPLFFKSSPFMVKHFEKTNYN